MAFVGAFARSGMKNVNEDAQLLRLSMGNRYHPGLVRDWEFDFGQGRSVV